MHCQLRLGQEVVQNSDMAQAAGFPPGHAGRSALARVPGARAGGFGASERLCFLGLWSGRVRVLPIWRLLAC